MKRRKPRSRKKSWFRRLFMKPRHTLPNDAISPSLMREGSGTDDLAATFSLSGTSPRRKRTWWSKLFGPRRRKIRKKLKPISFKPIESDLPRPKLQMSRRAMITINSTIMYLLAFVILYLIYQFTVIFIANRFGISGVLYYYQVFWPIGNSSPLWFPYYKIILITGSGPFVCLIVGLLFFRIFVPKTKNPVTKLFFLWIALHALNMFFGAFVAGVTTSDGFGYVALWLHMNIVFRILFSLVFLFALSAFGYYACKFFLETAQSPSFLQSEKRKQFLFFQALLPAILGAIILVLLRIPVNPPYQIILLITLFAAPVSAYFNHKAKPDRLKSFPKHHGRKLQHVYLLIAVLLLIGFRFGLVHGLHFIIRISMSISVFGASP